MARIPINLTTGTLKETNLIVGIDLGTTHSLVAKMEDGQPQCIADFGKDVIVPSIIHFGPGGSIVVGDDARAALETQPERTIYSVKRLLGKTFRDLGEHLNFFSYRVLESADAEGLVRVELDGKYYSPVELSSYILKELKARAEHKLKTEITKAVVTVPAYFNDAQRQATRDAGKLAGLDVLRIVNEPTAAALAYGIGLSKEEAKTIAVYDLGGGTFDITILRLEGGIFEVLSTHGDTYLGGDDMDRAIQQYWMANHGITETDLQANRSLGQTLRLQAESAKKHLSAHTEFTESFKSTGKAYSVSLTRQAFEGLIKPLVDRTIKACSQAMKDAGLNANQIDAVLLVGGSTRVPLVKQAVAQFFGQVPNDSLNPDEVVALGAAIQADILAGNRKDLLLLDVTPLSLGIETSGGLMDVLITRNSKLPSRAGRQYTTQVDGQQNMRISIYQGERELVADNRKLAEFELRGIPAMPAALPKVEITFLLDADGILQVRAEELRSGVVQEILVKPSYGLTDAEVEAMLLASLTHAQADISQRMVVEALEEGRQALYHAQNFLKKYGGILSDAEQLLAQQHMNGLQNAIDGGEKDAIHTAMDALENATRPFAERLMDHAIKEAIVGKTLPDA